MASALRLDDTPVAGPAAPFDQPDEGIGLSDYARAVAAGGYGVVGSTVGALDYLFNLPADTDVSRARAWAQRGAQSQIEQTSPAAQRALTANVLPGDGETIWDKNVSTSGALGLRTAQAIPSLLASIIPGGVVARVTASAGAGMAVGTGLAGMQSGGDLFNQISDELTKTPDDRLQTESEAYRGLRSMGMEEPDAKKLLVQQSAGYKPIIMAAITALTSRYGVEGMVAHRAAGQAGRGALRHGALGALSEATQEGVENFSQELLAQQGVFDAKGGAGNYDWHKALEQAVGGALVGATTGGAVGAATGGGHRRVVSNRLIDQDHEAALAPAPASEPRVVTPEVTPTGPEVVLDQKGTVAGHELDALDKTVKDAGANAGVVQHVDTPTTAPATPVGIGVDEAAALAHYDPKLGENPNASIQSNLEPADVAPPVPGVPDVPVVTPQVAQAITAPVQTAVQPTEPPLPEPEQPGGLQAPAQLAPERAAAPALEPTPVAEPTPAPTPAPATGRILENLKQRPRMGKLKKAQIEAGVAPEEVLSAKELRTKARQDELSGLAERVRAAQAKLAEPDASKGAPAARAYARDLVAASELGDVKLGNLAADADPALHLIKRAVQVGKGAGRASDAIAFTGTDLDVRGGATAGPRVVGGVSFNEDIGDTEGVKGGTINVQEEAAAEEADAKRAAARRAELDKAEAERQAKARAEAEAKTAAAMQDLVAGEAKRPVMVERKRAVTPQGKRENLFERRAREAAEKEAAAAAAVERTRKERETAREKGIAEMMALMQERDQILAGHTDFADAMLPARDMADKIVAVQRRLETQLGNKSLADQARRSAVQQHEQTKKQAAGEATATTPAEAAAQLQTQLVEENRDALASPALQDTTGEFRALARADSETLGTTTTLGKIIDSGQLLTHKTGEAREEIKGVHRLLMGEMARRIRRLANDVPVHIVDDETAFARWKEIGGDPAITPAAFYDGRADEIVARHNEVTPEAIVHEGMHAAYYRAVEENPKLKEHVESLRDEVALQWLREQDRAGRVEASPPYGLRDAHEFIAEAFSNPEFQALLMRTPASAKIAAEQHGFKHRPLISIWHALIRHIKQVLFKEGGPSIGILEQVIRATHQIDMVAERQRSRAPMMGALALRVGQGPEINVKEALTNFAGDRGPGVAKWWRGTAIKGMALNQLNTVFGKYFDRARGEGNPIQRIYDAVSRQERFTEENRKAGNELAQKAVALESQFGERALDGWMIARDSTMAGVDPTPGASNDHLGKNVARNVQRKAALARLQPEFAKLPQEVRDYIHEAAKYFGDQQDLKTKALIANILKGFESAGLTQPLSVQAYAQLTTNTMEGKLTDADAAILDNETAFNALKNSSELRKVEGLYFPLMRHGNHVVRTWTALGELHDGVVGKPDANGNVEVTWEGAKKRDVLAQYTKFAESTKALITSTTTERYINGKRVSEEEARGQTHTVVQRARVQTRGLEAFDTDAEATRFIKNNRDNYERIDPKPLPKEEDPRSGEVSHAQFSSIMSALNKREGLDPAFKSMLESNLREAVISRMAGNRIEQRSLPRRNVAGASTDMARNMLQYSEASSRYLGKLRYTQEIHEALTHMRELTKLSDKDSQVRTQVLQELTKRFGENVANINEPPRALRLLMTATMMARLASPMYHVVNGTQPGMVTLPVLAGHYGMLRSAAALMRSYGTVGAGKLLWSGVTDTATAVRHIREVGLDTSDLMGSLRAKLAKEPDGAGLVRMFDELVRTGQLNPEKGFELASAVTRGGKTADVALAKVERITRQMGHAVEALNRATTAVTAYRLGRSIAKMTEEQATAHAKDMVDQTQFNYSTYNQPRFMKNHPWASPAFQFKKYAQNMIFLMGDMVRRASFGTSQEKKIAARQLMSLLAVQMAMAGAAGLPGLELLKVGFMVASMLGLGGGWEDWQRKLRKTFEASIGKTPTELISKGVLTRGIAQFVPFPDLSSRVSLADLATYGEPKSGSRDDTQAYLFNLIAGAPGGLVLDWADAAKLAGEGEFGKAFIKAVPAKIVADIAKAVKGYTDRDLNEGEAVIQALGARSVRAANEGETKGEAIATNKKLEEERKQLTRQYINATSQGELLKLKARILAHNAQAKETNHPRQSVGTKGLDAIRAKEKARRDKIQGE